VDGQRRLRRPSSHNVEKQPSADDVGWAAVGRRETCRFGEEQTARWSRGMGRWGFGCIHHASVENQPSADDVGWAGRLGGGRRVRRAEAATRLHPLRGPRRTRCTTGHQTEEGFTDTTMMRLWARWKIFTAYEDNCNTAGLQSV
jgi:hypothetical protein